MPRRMESFSAKSAHSMIWMAYVTSHLLLSGMMKTPETFESLDSTLKWVSISENGISLHFTLHGRKHIMSTIAPTPKQIKLMDALLKLGFDASFPFKFSNNVHPRCSFCSPDTDRLDHVSDCPNKTSTSN